MVEVLRSGTVLGQAKAAAYRNELDGTAGAGARHAFWFLPTEPIGGLENIHVRVAGTNHYLPLRVDPIAIPSDDLIFSVVGGRNIVPQFMSTGGADRVSIQRLIEESSLTIKPGSRILDWGAGCGRIARHWADRSADVEFYGCDINEQSIAWCQKNMPFGKYQVSKLLPPLPYPDNHFDVLYGISVLTHLLFDTHYLWMSEIWRVLKPGGVAVLTACGPSFFPIIATQIGHGFKAKTHALDKGMFIGIERVEGSNETGNTTTCDVMEKIFHPFKMLDHRPCYGLMGIQDSYVFHKGDSAKLHHVPKALECALSGKTFEAEIALPTKNFRRCSFLAAARNLVSAASVEFSLEFPGSSLRPIRSVTRLPDKARWTSLEAAYSFATIDNVPRTDGDMKLVVRCKSEHSMDEAMLLVHNALFV